MNPQRRQNHHASLWQTLAIEWHNLTILWHTFAISALVLLAPNFAFGQADKTNKTATATNTAATATDESELVRLAYSDALTGTEKAAKNAARAQLNKRGLDKLRILFDHVHVPNMYIRFDIDSIVHRNRATVGPTLLNYIDSPHVRTRSYASYYLSFTPLREHREKIVPLLDHDGTRTSAIRALGKWAATNQLDRVSGYIDDDNERRRITAINAVRDIGDPSAIPKLLPALDDDMLTVRFVAERALAEFGDKKALRRALKDASPKAAWHLESALETIRETNRKP